MTQGWSYTVITPELTVWYYDSVLNKMGKNQSEWMRLFMVPGMQHCGGGPGPNTFGQGGVAQADPMHDVAAAIEQWVEKGKAPDRIVAVHFPPGTRDAKADRTRPLCPYPEVAKYNGSGSTDDASNFVCAKE